MVTPRESGGMGRSDMSVLSKIVGRLLGKGLPRGMIIGIGQFGAFGAPITTLGITAVGPKSGPVKA